MVNYAVVVEFARDVVDDERHDELEDLSLATTTHSMASSAYLNDDADQNESLISTLGANTHPPNFGAKSPIFGTTNALSFGEYRLEKFLFCDQGSLPTAHKKQLLIVSLVQADTDWQV